MPQSACGGSASWIGLNRASYYLTPAVESAENLTLMRLLDEQYLQLHSTDGGA
ncbi:MAG: hypothetical protein R3A44_25930 [Caldilineaceae bacterium]